MNENLNLVEILKDCPEGTKLYSPLFGDVEFIQCNHQSNYPILVKNKNGGINGATSQGKAYANFDGECVLFPSKDQRDWNKFKIKKPKFDPKTLQPFDKVLAKSDYFKNWRCDLFSHIKIMPDSLNGKIITNCGQYDICVPYNDDTKHLVGTDDEAPEFYRYWEA